MVDAQGGDGIRTVQELQALLEMHAPESMVLAASFKTPRQALDCLLAGCESITLPLDVAQQMLNTPAVESAIHIDCICSFLEMLCLNYPKLKPAVAA